MKKKIICSIVLTAMAAFMLAGCGKGTDKDTVATDGVVETVKKGEVEETKEGLIVTTETGDKIVLSDKVEVTKNEDGTTTYTTEDGTKVTVDEDGEATVTPPASSETAKNDTPKPPKNGSGESTKPSEDQKPASSENNKPSEQPESSETPKPEEPKPEAPKHTHSYTWVTTKEATCTKEGEKVEKCSCGKTGKTEKIAKKDHKPGDWIVTAQATCTSNGSKHKVCSVCGKETAVEAINSTGAHNYAWETSGNTRTMKCAGCGAKGITEQNYGGIWGYYDDGAAATLFSLVNAERNSAGTVIEDDWGNVIDTINVPALSGGLESIAKQRAVECATNFSHEGLKTANECLASGQGSAQGAYENWCYSSTHAKTMINADYTQGGTACFWYDADGSGQNLYPIWVLVVN